MAQLQQARIQLESERSELGSIREPKTIIVGQRDLSVENIIDTTGRAISQAHGHPLVLPNTMLLLFSSYPAVSYRSIASTQHTSVSASNDYLTLLSHHKAIILATQPLLEYNPEADLGNVKLNDDQIRARMDAADKGLQKIQSQLDKVPTLKSDTTIPDLEATISKLQSSLQVYKSTKNKDAWYADVAAAQKAVIANRQKFWANASATNGQRLLAADKQLAELVTPQ